MAHTLAYTVQCSECSELFDITLDPVPDRFQTKELAKTYRDKYVHRTDVVPCPHCSVDLHVNPVIAPDEKHIASYTVSRCSA